MTIYMIDHGCHHDGYTIEGAYGTLEGARQRAYELLEEDAEDDYPTFVNVKEKKPNLWEDDHNNYIRIEEYEVI